MAIKEINYYKLHFTYVYGGRNCFKNVNMREEREREREREIAKEEISERVNKVQTKMGV